MKFSVAYEHRQFFSKQNYIEFDELLTCTHCSELTKAIDITLAKRLSVDEVSVSKQPADKVFKVGRDLWRTNDHVKKLVMQPHLSAIAADLVQTKDVRLGYDLLFPELSRRFTLTHGERKLEDFLSKTHSLNEMSCLDGIACGLLICLSEPAKPELSSEEAYIPKIPGNGIYLSPELVIDFPKLAPQQGNYFLIVYTYSSAYYILNEEDPHAHELKHLGYHFGDKLTDKINPIVHRAKGG